MRRNVLAWLLLTLTICGLVVSTSRAEDPPEILDHYRLLPRFSTLHQSGGFAGVDWRYRLIGGYDLRHGAGWTARASFENAEVWGSIISSDPHPAFVIDVDQILNLEGLHGEALPVGGAV